MAKSLGGTDFMNFTQDWRKSLATLSLTVIGIDILGLYFYQSYLQGLNLLYYLMVSGTVLTIVTLISAPSLDSGITRGDGEFLPASILSVSLTVLSSALTYLLILKMFGIFYEGLLLIPFVVFAPAHSGRNHDSQNKKEKAMVPGFAAATFIYAMLAFFVPLLPGSSILYSFPFVLLLSFASVRFSIKTSNLGSAGRKPLVPVFSLAASEFVYLSYPFFSGSGIALFLALIAIITVLGVLVTSMSRVSFISHLRDSVLLVALAGAFIFLLLQSLFSYLILYLILSIVSITVYANNLMDGQSRLLTKSLKIGNSYLPSLPVIGLAVTGVAYVCGLIPDIFFARSYRDVIILSSELIGFFSILLVLTGLSRIGNGKSNAILFPATAILFAIGLLYILSFKAPGIWDPSFSVAAIITIVIAVLVMYEPSFRVAKTYFRKIPITLSISHQMGGSQYLHARYDVNLEKNKKRNKDLLGAGGFAYVFRGRDVVENEDVVIKIPRVYDIESKGEREKKELLQDAIKQLTSESKILSSLNHPGIVGYIDFFKENNDYFLVEEYANGKNMSRYLGNSLRPGQRWTEGEILDFATKLLLSINYLHMHEVYHRDLNPGNVVMSEGFPKIIDFGTSKNLLGRMTKSFFSHSQRVGVPCYHPPELDLDQKITASGSYDTYSVGALMCSMITGKFLDDEEMRNKYGLPFVNAKYLSEEIAGRVSERMFSVIKKSLSYDARNRYESAFEVIMDLFDLTGEFIVTDLGQIHALDPDSRYNVVLNKEQKPALSFARPIGTGEIGLRDYVKVGKITAGEIYFDDEIGGMSISTYQRRNVYRKNLGNSPEKGLKLPIEPGYTYSFSQDHSGGIFTYYRRL